MEAVSRVAQKDRFSFSVLLADDVRDKSGEMEAGTYLSAADKLALLREWSGDDVDSILGLGCIDPALDGKYVFLEPFTFYAIYEKSDLNDERQQNGYVATLNLMEA